MAGMARAQRIWRITCGIAAAALVLAHTLALVGGAINRLAAGPEQNVIDKMAGGFLGATGTLQRWNMFSPDVGDECHVPFLLVTFRDGSKRILSSPATPPMAGGDPLLLARGMIREEQRRMEWTGHFADARRRKLDTRISDPVSGTWEQGTTYARWLLNKHLGAHPQDAERIAFVDLYIAVVRHYGEGELPRRGDLYYISVYPQFDPLWPPGIRTSLGHQPLPPRGKLPTPQ